MYYFNYQKQLYFKSDEKLTTTKLKGLQPILKFKSMSCSLNLHLSQKNIYMLLKTMYILKKNACMLSEKFIDVFARIDKQSLKTLNIVQKTSFFILIVN